MTQQNDKDMLVLEYIHDYDRDLGGGAGLAGLWELVGEEQARVSASSLRDRGLIRDEQRLSGGYHITGAGREEVEALRARRQDRGHRRRGCREQVLRHLDNIGRTDSIVSPSSFAGSLDGVPFTNDDLQDALTYLVDQGLIKGHKRLGNGDHYLVTLGPHVSDCVDSGLTINDFLDQQRSGVITTNNFNMGGSGNNFVNAVGEHATANATIQTFNPDLARLFARAIRAAETDLSLGAEQHADLVVVEQSDDRSLAQRATQRLYEHAAATTTGALGGVLGTLGASALGIG